jgi:hypothetical protein
MRGGSALLAEAEALRTLAYGEQEVLLQLFEGVVLRQVQLVEARVRRWEAVLMT